MKSQTGGGVGRGFTLVELLVVILIIALVIAIVLPALGGARTAAKAADTKNLIKSLTDAVGAYRNDNGRNPGYFDAREMGAKGNESRGFTAAHNMMLDLAGGFTDENGPNVLEVGPDANSTVSVDVGLIGAKGANSRVYVELKSKYFQPQDGTDNGELADDAEPAHKKLPHLVDSWGTPLLVWSQDETAVGSVTKVEDFARINTDGDGVARFYWASNAGLLKATRLGRMGRNQLDDSLLGGAPQGPDKRRESLAGVLGNPSYPNQLSAPNEPILPTAPRGRLVVISAGPDGVYFRRGDTGSKLLSDSNVIDYRDSFFKGNDRWKDDNGNETNRNILEKFDDIVVTGGN